MPAYKEDTIIGVKELRTKLPAIAKAAGRGERFLVMRHHTPLFRIEPPAAPTQNRESLADMFKDIQFHGTNVDKNLSKNIDKIVYGV